MSNNFLSPQNTKLLWDLLTEEPIVQNLPKNKQDMLYNTFNTHIHSFYKNENENGSEQNLQLVNLNKSFLSIMLKMIRNNNSINNNSINNISIDNVAKTYKIEDIQSERQKSFDIQLKQRQNEFERLHAPKKPPVPNFAENIENDKIKNIDELIAQAISQRNLDINPLNMLKENPVQQISSTYQPPIKYIKIKEPLTNDYSNDIIELPDDKHKHNNDNDNNDNNNNNNNKTKKDINILDKLKIVKDSSNDELYLNDKIYNLDKKMDVIINMLQNIVSKITT